jgi:endoglucanase
MIVSKIGALLPVLVPVLVIAVACTEASPAARPAEVAPAATAQSQGAPRTQWERLTPIAGSQPQHGGNILLNANFASGEAFPWLPSFTPPARGQAAVSEGHLCADVESAGLHEWDAQLRQRNLTIKRGHTYWVHFGASSTVPTSIRAKVGAAGPPYGEYFAGEVDLTPGRDDTFGGKFTMNEPDDASAEIVFQFGGPLAKASGPSRICLDGVYLEDPDSPVAPAIVTKTLPKLRVNGVGYAPAAPKRAMLVSQSPTPLPWQLLNGQGAALAEGHTIVSGADAASGDALHVIDFSTYTGAAKGLSVRVGSDTSASFDIGARIYKPLKYDALAFFYQMRSGTPIEMPFARDARYVRPAGHPGDTHVTCAPDLGCDETLDVHGGWYDAGDQGKYVVTGAFSAWMLLDEYERALHVDKSAGEFADGTMTIPERTNRVPDLLDEARWEIAFLLEMQVPEGRPLAGMVHHKVHDKRWTPIPTAPDKDPEPRYLHPPSTAATLDLAAVAAQCARVYKPFDPAFAGTCLTAAERAWDAAKKNPSRMASPSDNVGGGAYDDSDLSDELYWAASELFITTGKPAYHEAMTHSPRHLDVPAVSGQAFGWQTTAALGTISLSFVPSAATSAEVAAARKSLVAAGDTLASLLQGQGYRVPLSAYYWGSNSVVLDNAVVLALAYDFTQNRKYLSGVVDSMDYILGRNAIATSMVTGYGERAVEHPHHRFWAHQADGRFPPPPPGCLVGGPNADVQDPVAKPLQGRPPAKCWVDDIGSYSTNEVAINWNAALAWVSAFLDDELGLHAPRAN